MLSHRPGQERVYYRHVEFALLDSEHLWSLERFASSVDHGQSRIA
jgi:hypothetical protein